MNDFFDLQLFVEVDVGTPPQRMRVIADTGSKWVWVQSKHCRICGGSRHYDPDRSETLTELSTFHQRTASYGSGDVKGYHSREDFCLAVPEDCYAQTVKTVNLGFGQFANEGETENEQEFYDPNKCR